ncbi:MAG TPA: hypothetical protein VMD78_07950 [Candidatus Baltobacteraceae bacterium]|nr:hypothetical protein [Candidatus Baltobacteraceae bacterium]
MTDDRRPNCPCARCRMRSLLGPVMIITIGVIFLLSEYTRFGIGHLWPLFLIVLGVFRLAESMVSDEGHIRS